METFAQHKNARMSPRKLRLARETVLGLPVAEAEARLKFMPGKAAGIIAGVLKSAVANATHNNEAEADALKVADVVINEGIVMKRWMPRSRGQANPILKRTSHVTVVVGDDKKDQPKAKSKKAKVEIETISAADLVKQQAEEVAREADEIDDEPNTGTKAMPDKTAEASGKTKTVQQGGNKPKTHRRKSI